MYLTQNRLQNGKNLKNRLQKENNAEKNKIARIQIGVADRA